MVEEMLSQRSMLPLLQPLWRIMQQWERLGRAVSPGVAWARAACIERLLDGVCLLESPYPVFRMERLFKKACKRYDDLQGLKKIPNRRSAQCGMFYAALFHDIAYCVEQLPAAAAVVSDLARTSSRWRVFPKTSFATLRTDCRRLLERLRVAAPWSVQLTSAVNASVRKGRPDHGMVAAVTLLRKTENSHDAELIQIAAEAIAMHSVLADVKATVVEWPRHPLAALLLLYRQLQTWDRERDDQEIDRHESDRAQRAELTHFAVVGADQTRRYNPYQLCLPGTPPVRSRPSSHVNEGGSRSGFARTAAVLDRIGGDGHSTAGLMLLGRRASWGEHKVSQSIAA